MIESSFETSERACLIGFNIRANVIDGRNVSLEELEALTATAGAEPVATLICARRAVHPAFFVGSGKVAEIAELCRQEDIHAVVFDHNLSPAQTRNLERETEAKIIDRTGLILEIFAQHARSREGKLQVELAQLEYMLPRLTRLWTHLSRQYGGLGTRGPGEKQLEVDRRRVQARIQRLHTLLAQIRKSRATQRKRRKRSQVPVVGIVGYTNAGKSTFLRGLTHADVVVEDKLFATLDPTTRAYHFDTGERYVFVDMVGFIRNLPHSLVEAFKATLEETREADVLLHIADASVPDLSSQIAAVHTVLQELDADDKPQVLALNKADLLSHRKKKQLQAAYTDATFISAQYGYGFTDLLEKLRAQMMLKRRRTRLRLPPHKSELLSKLYKQGKVISAKYEDDGVVVDALVPESLQSQTRRYRVKEIKS